MKITFIIFTLSMLITSLVSGCECKDRNWSKKSQEISIGSSTIRFEHQTTIQEEYENLSFDLSDKVCVNCGVIGKMYVKGHAFFCSSCSRFSLISEYPELINSVQKIDKQIDDTLKTTGTCTAKNDISFYIRLGKKEPCSCQCSSEFKKDQPVYDIVKGSGIVKNINPKVTFYPVEVKFPHHEGSYLYTRDGKWSSGDLYPSLYHQKMRIVPENSDDNYTSEWLKDVFRKLDTQLNCDLVNGVGTLTNRKREK